MKKIKNQYVFIILLLAALVAAFFLKPKPAGAPGNPSSPPTTNYKLPTTTLFLAGDIMLSRNVARKIYAANDPTLPFQKTSDVTQKADIAFANLESPFNDTGNHSVEGSLVFNADPNFISGLTYAGFDILSTANNHAFDQGQKGIDFTLELLGKNNIIPTGTRSTTTTPILPVIEKNGIQYGFLSYSYTALNDGGKSTSPYVADFNNLEQVKQDIVDLKGHNADVVIVNMHAGVEYTRQPTQKQINFAHAAIDAGADIVVGEHPHWVQTVEQYKGKWIFYGLGNFVFDQMWSDETRKGLTVLVTYKNSQIEKIELKPVIIDDYSTPRWANSDESAAILNSIGLTSPVLFNNN